MSIRALQLIPRLDLEAGGPPVAAVATAVALQECGVSTVFAFPIDGRRPGTIEDLRETLHARGIPVHAFRESLYGAATRRWGVSPRMALWVVRSSKRFDVIHAHMGWSVTAITGLAAARLRGSVAVLTPHETLADYDREKSGPVKAFVKWSLRAAYVRLFDLVVVASPLEHESLGRAGRRRSLVIAHAVEPSGPLSPRPRESGCRVGFLARLDPKKNLDVLIQALALLPESVSLRVGGEGPPEYEKSLAALAAEHQVDGRIEWLGFVDPATKNDFFASIDVLAMPSAFECFGVSAAEAMWVGIPVVVSNRVGIAHVVTRHSCGEVVEPTPEDVARGIRALAEPETRNQASAKARRAAEAEFSRAAHGERLREAYEAALRARSERRGRRRRRSANR